MLNDPKRLIFCFIITSLISTPKVLAQSKAALDLPDIHQHCVSPGQLCLEHIEQPLQETPEYTAHWYELMLYKLDSLFELQQSDALLALTQQLVLKNDAPAYFSARIFIYHAKVLFIHANQLQAEHYLQKAVDLLASMHEADPNPWTMIRLANVQLYAETGHEQGFNRLLQLEQRYSKSHDPVLKYEMYNNLGHYSHHLDHLELSAKYRQKALQVALLSDDTRILAEAYYNLARSLTHIEQWAAAQSPFEQALVYYQQINDKALVALSQMNLAEVLWHQRQYTAAQQQFAEADTAVIPSYNLERYQQIATLLQQTPADVE